MGYYKGRRKRIGPELKIAIDQELIDAIDINTSLLGISRAELIRQLLRDGLDRLDTNTRRTA